MAGDSSFGPEVTRAVCQEIEARDLSTTQAAQLFGVSDQTIRNWRDGTRIRCEYVELAANVFDMAFEDFAGTPESRAEAIQADREAVAALISEGLDDAAVSVLAGYTPRTIGLVIVTALDQFSRGVRVAGE